MRRPSWNKSQAIQQVLSLKGLFDDNDDKDDEEKSLKPSTCPKSTNTESSLIQDVQQPRLALYAHTMPTAMSQQSSSMVNEAFVFTFTFVPTK